MASKRIKGITIEIGADTKELTKAISEAEKKIGDAAYKLRDINKLLKADPKNVELLTQKQEALNEALKGTREKLRQEQEALEQLGRQDQTDDVKEKQKALQREIIETKQSLEQLEDEYRDFGSVAKQQSIEAGEAMKAAGEKVQAAGQAISGVGRTMTTYVTTPIVAGFTASAKAAIDWESAFTGVKKTVDGTDEEYERLADAIKEMSSEMMASKEEIAGVMEVAGQLGVTGVDNLIAFTKTAVMLGDTTNLSADTAATSFARILNITGDGYDKVSNMGSAVVDLGNNMATSESEIVEMANRLASAGKISGLTTQEILALSAAMSSVGIQAEAGGTAMAQTMKGIQDTVSKATAADATQGQIDALETLASVAGKTAEEFAQSWQTKPMQTIQDFINGLSNLKESGGDTFAILDELGMSGIRQSNMLQSLALASDQLSKATNISNTAWSENTALSDEAAKRYDTMEAKLFQLKESLSTLAGEVGDRLLPYIEKAVGYIDQLIEKFKGLSDEQIDTAVKIAALVAVIGPALMIIGGIITGIGKLIFAFGQIKIAIATIGGWISTLVGWISAAAGAVTSALTHVATIMGTTAGALLGAIGLVVAAIVVWIKNWDAIKEAAGLFCERTAEHFQELKESLSQTFADVQEAAGLLKERTAEHWEELKAKASEIWGGIKTTISEKVENAVASVKEFFEGLGDFFGGLVEKAKKWGSDLIGGIKSGIESGISGVKNAANKVGTAIHERLHFSEPDVGPLSDFNSWMPDMMKQMAQQINAGIPGVTSAMQNVAGSMRGEFAPDYSGQLASINNGIGQLAAAGGGNITVPVYIGQQKFAQAVVDAGRLNTYRNGGR